jgi:pimeloyl-ACP methyl ester carboxylesterase
LSQEINVYFFPGQGSDERLFRSIVLDSTKYNCVYFNYPVPEKNSSLKDFAYLFIDSINQKSPFILIGTSFGGLICSELADTLSPKKTIVISSAKIRNELPHRYRFQRVIPLYKVFPKKALLGGAKIMQPLVEPDRNKYKETFKSMLDNKDPLYMKRSIGMIIRWSKKEYNPSIIHIHGAKDNTIPIRKVDVDHIVENGSHMMTLTMGEEISKILNKVILTKTGKT